MKDPWVQLHAMILLILCIENTYKSALISSRENNPQSFLKDCLLGYNPWVGSSTILYLFLRLLIKFSLTKSTESGQKKSMEKLGNEIRKLVAKEKNGHKRKTSSTKAKSYDLERVREAFP